MKNRQKKEVFHPIIEVEHNFLRIYICIFLVTATIAVYWQVQNHEFLTYDDAWYITENPNIQSGLTRASIIWAFTEPYASNWHPVTWLSHMLDFEFYGLDPLGHHLTNLIFHIANTLLLFVVLLKMTGALWRSAMVATLFALHPLNVESVAWVAERKNVLSTFFWLLTMWAYAIYVINRRVYPLVIFCLALGLMAKPMLVTLPFVLMLLDFWPLKRWRDTQTIKKLILEKIPLFLLVLVASLTTYLVQKSGGAVKSIEFFSISSRISNALVSYLEYLEKMVWPKGLSVFYPHPGNALPVWKAWVCGLVLVGITTWVIKGIRRRPYFAVGWFWYLGTLVPVIGIVQVGEQAMADRYMYVPLVGIFIAIVWGVAEWIKKEQQKILALLVGGCVFLLMIITKAQVAVWKNGITLMEHSAGVVEKKYLSTSTIYSLLGDAYHKKGALTLAISEFKRSLNINPNNRSSISALAVILEEQGNLKEAEVYHRQAIKLGAGSHLDFFNLGNTLYKLGKLTEAVLYYKKAIGIDPGFVKAYYNLGNALGSQDRVKQAELAFKQAINLDRELYLAHYALGVLYQRQGKTSKAIGEFEYALSLNPKLEQAHQFLGDIYMKIGKEQISKFHIQSAEKISGKKN